MTIAAERLGAVQPLLVRPGAYGSTAGTELRREVNLDYAATTPALATAVDAVLRVVPAYGSVHRGGGGARSRVTTAAYEQARAAVARFLDCPETHDVVFVRNTTDAINVVAAMLPAGARVLCSPFEHHANLLPWRTHEVRHLPFTSSAAALSAAARSELAGTHFDLLAVTGASNVTGEIPPLGDLVAAARRAGTAVLVDAAQLAPHRPVSVRELDVDFLAVSGHKLYAPFGSGALVVRREAVPVRPPPLKGGGAVKAVALDAVAWAEPPHLLEAGTPNVLGAVALGAACDELARFGLDELAREERLLAERLWDGLMHVDGVRVLRLWDDADRVGVATFEVAGRDARAVAAELARRGIAVRSGLFCAHPLVSHLLGTSDAVLAEAAAGGAVVLPAAVRASIGLGVTAADVDALLAGVAELAATA